MLGDAVILAAYCLTKREYQLSKMKSVLEMNNENK